MQIPCKLLRINIYKLGLFVWGMKKRDYFFVMILLLIISISSAELTSDNYSIISEGTSSGGGDFDSDNFSTIAVSGFVSGEASSDNYTGQVGILYGVISGGNTAPTISLLTPSDGNSTFDRTPTFTYTGNDIDGDSFLYDINITKRLVETGNVVGIKVLDHLIISDSKYLSLMEKGYMS